MILQRSIAQIVAVIMVASGSSSAEEAMSLDFSWEGVKACATLSPNPEIRVAHIPGDAKVILLLLTQGQRELGGQELAIPQHGVLPVGVFRTYGPCKPDVYRWTVLAKSATGAILAEAEQARFFPSGELVKAK